MTGLPRPPRDSVELRRLLVSPAGGATTTSQAAPWREWGPYVAARQWGTVREDYSGDQDAWRYFPFEQAHARAYRWGEDGLAAISDRDQYLCLGVALWNGADALLKERLFGLTNAEGNHGEDVKEYWWVTDGTPTHSWMRLLYRYPQRAFPYQRLREENARRGREDPEFELADTGVLDADRFFDVDIAYAKATPHDICLRITATNHGPEPAPLHILPQLWFRNTWGWGDDGAPRPRMSRDGAALRCGHPVLGDYWAVSSASARLLLADNDTNAVRLFGATTNPSAYPKDGINDHVVHGAATVDPDGVGTKAAFWHRWDAVAPGASVTAELRLSRRRRRTAGVGADFAGVLRRRQAEADAFYAGLLPASLSDAERLVARRGFAGLLWTKQSYRYDVRRWLSGDPGQPVPPARRWQGRNHRWPHVDTAAVMTVPDEWEYPWFAAWDLAFQAVALAHVDPAFAKEQLVLLCRQWLMHPDGQLPAYEWSFGDVNPPVHAWAALRVFRIDAARTGRGDRTFLARIFGKLLLNFSWWVNRKDADGSNLFEGGFLGMDNISVFDRSAAVPAGHRLEQSDATSWMAAFSLAMFQIAVELAAEDAAYDDIAATFLDHFVAIGAATQTFGSTNASLWDERDGFCYDVLVDGDGRGRPVRLRSMVGLVPVLACATVDPAVLRRLPEVGARLEWLARRRPEALERVLTRREDGTILLSLLTGEQLRRVLHRMLDEGEFLSPFGIRSLSAAYRGGTEVDVDGVPMRIAYEPAESRGAMFGGNSNWRGPLWLPLNVLLASAVHRYGRFFGPEWRVELPAGSGSELPLTAVAEDLERRLVSLFLPDATGRRPADPAHHGTGALWSHPTFSEYFHGDTGAGLGASHQTGWSALVAALLATRP